MTLPIIYTRHHRLHATGDVWVEAHPLIVEELPERVEIIRAALVSAALGEVVAPEDHGEAPILTVHDADFVAHLRSVYRESADYFGIAAPVMASTFATRYTGSRPEHFLGQRGYYAFGTGSPILEGTWEAAYWSAQCALSAAGRILRGDRVAYALCRPPGHHAAADLYGGFCYLNNAAIAARALQQEGGRVAVLDVDYHHGNGTQAIFYDDPEVLYYSIHADPTENYPFYWGYADERGAGPGEGTNYNAPLPRGTGDADYLRHLDAALLTIADFAPQALVLSLGLDTAVGDEVGGFTITPEGFREMGRRIADLGLPTAIVQEGGYRLATLGENAVAFFSDF